MSSPNDVLWTCDRGTRAKLEILQSYLGAWFNILAQGGVKDVIYAQKPFFTRPAREDVLKPLMARADAVVTGVGE